MKRVLCWLLMGMGLLSLCCCAPAAPVMEASVPETAAAPTLTPAPTPTFPPAATIAQTVIPAPSSTPTPTAVSTPALTPSPAPTATPAPTSEPRSVAKIVEEMAVYYARYGEKAGEKVASLLQEMGAAYPEEAAKWTEIMDRWRTLDDRVTVHLKVLPDGLPDTDELCIVALGYQLNANGTMKEQLKERLKVVVRSAQKYPNAWVLCTGGGTASHKKSATEAGQMASYLKKNGVSKKRILVEKSSKTTAQNARYSLDLLLRDYPQVKYIAIVSGDYHIKTGVLFFEAEAILRAQPGEAPGITVVANAACKTSKEEQSPQYRAAGLIELAGNHKAANDLNHDRYNFKKWPPLS